MRWADPGNPVAFFCEDRMDARVKLALRRSLVRDTSGYFRTQITRVTDAFISSTPGLPDAGAT